MTKVLILGGTGFAGYAIAERALRCGWDVTTLHRGRSNPPPGASSVIADRLHVDGLNQVASEPWDIVVDTWSGEPEAVRNSALALASRAGLYVYVSTRSVYRWPAPEGANEGAPLVSIEGEPIEFGYGERKLACEQQVLAEFTQRALIARAGLILGPREGPGRLPWWLTRIARGGTVPVPGPPTLDLQYIDVRDLADWIISSATAGATGIFDTVGPVAGTTMLEIFESCRDVTASSADFLWVSPEAVSSAGIEPWTELPLWLPPGPDHAALNRSDPAAALQAGLLQRPIFETISDTWGWLQANEAVSSLRGVEVGLDQAKEQALIKAARSEETGS